MHRGSRGQVPLKGHRPRNDEQYRPWMTSKTRTKVPTQINLDVSSYAIIEGRFTLKNPSYLKVP